MQYFIIVQHFLYYIILFHQLVGSGSIKIENCNWYKSLKCLVPSRLFCSWFFLWFICWRKGMIYSAELPTCVLFCFVVECVPVMPFNKFLFIITQNNAVTSRCLVRLFLFCTDVSKWKLRSSVWRCTIMGCLFMTLVAFVIHHIGDILNWSVIFWNTLQKETY